MPDLIAFPVAGPMAAILPVLPEEHIADNPLVKGRITRYCPYFTTEVTGGSVMSTGIGVRLQGPSAPSKITSIK